MKNSLNKERLEKLLKDTENALIVTDNGIVVTGNSTETLFMFCKLVEALNEFFPKEHLKYAFELGLGEEKK